ncbi:hypothetical protein D3C87_545580 [compost metagenome]
MERTFISKQEGPTQVWITDDPEKIAMLTRPGVFPLQRHTVVLKGHPFDLFLIGPGTDQYMGDTEGAIAFARDFMTTDSCELMDMARVLLLHEGRQ